MLPRSRIRIARREGRPALKFGRGANWSPASARSAPFQDRAGREFDAFIRSPNRCRLARREIKCAASTLPPGRSFRRLVRPPRCSVQRPRFYASEKGQRSRSHRLIRLGIIL